jgi:trigger factor
MNISKENIDALNAIITLDIEKADYEPKVDEVLKNYRKRATLPGFRPGKVPAGMIKKMYGKAVLVEEVNKLVGESLMNYIKDNELDILGEPLPSDKMETIDFDKEVDTIQFKFDIALAPEVSLEINEKIKVPYYTINITDEMVESQVKMITSRFGTREKVEVVGGNAMLKGKISQNGEVKNEVAVISTSAMKDDAEKAKFVGAKLNDEVTFDIRKTFPNDTELSYIVGVSKEEAAEVNGEYVFAIDEITEFVDAELNQNVFDQVYGEGVVKSVEEFTAKTKEELAKTNGFEEDYRFALDVQKVIMGKVKMDLPEEFLKRWLTAINRENEKFTPELMEQEFPRFLEDLKWQVVKNSVMKKNDLKVEHEDLFAYAKKSAQAQFLQYGLTNVPEENLNNYALSLLKNEQQSRQISEGAVNDKVVAFLKEKVKLDNKSVTRDEFNKLFEE